MDAAYPESGMQGVKRAYESYCNSDSKDGSPADANTEAVGLLNRYRKVAVPEQAVRIFKPSNTVLLLSRDKAHYDQAIPGFIFCVQS